MNSESANGSQRNLALEMLKKSNAAAVQTITEEPYQPVVYAIPKEHWLMMTKLLQEAVQFQPTLYKQIEGLATWNQINLGVDKLLEAEEQYLQALVTELTTANGETHRKLEQTISQAGRMQEESTSKISAAVKTEVQKMDGLVSSLSQRMTKFLIGTAAASVLLSVLACVVLWLSVA